MAGSVTIANLVRPTLRLRPDRDIVGEVRGCEALDMLKAWNTGHPGASPRFMRTAPYPRSTGSSS
ncbi:ATPase, T2SS/T4P/T4SS family [Sphingopyxis sp.]|uniref:ATPase, T2SS/T4P/T4SS family n=1 Tax=Sphingopyxis sp. TaxID=1908224 RepID=UPI003FA7EDA0